MPNQFTVYMHDTPMKRLFSSRVRPFSAGCVRVQNIYGFAGLLLGEYEEDVKRRLEPLLLSGTKTTLKLAAPVPVHFTYLTAWTDAGGDVEFRHDLYEMEGGPVKVAQADGRSAPLRVDPWQARVFEISP